MRLLKCLVTVGLTIVMCSISANSFAVPLCSQVTFENFCWPCDPPGGHIEWQGDCTNEDREWRCVWDNCPGPNNPSPWIGCNCPGEGPGCDCLLAGTPITLADGTTKPVEAIQVGDRVLSFNELTRKMTESVVVAVHSPFVTDQYFVINGNLRVTQTHPFLSGGRWIDATNLKVGDIVAGDGSGRTIYSIKQVEEKALAYNFQVASGTYLAAGMIVHNKENCEHIVQFP